MRFLNRFRAADAIHLAGALIDKNLQLLAGANPAERGSRGKGATIVMDLWRAMPKVANGSEKPEPVLLAAGALAKAIRESELDGDDQKSDVLHGTLQLLWLADLGRSLERKRLEGIDQRLFESARSVLRVSWLSKLRPGDQ